MRLNYKQLTVVPLLFLLLVLLSACSLNKPTNTNNANNGNIATTTNDNGEVKNGLKTYKNEQYGFSFQYPASWYIDECGDPRIVVIDDQKVDCNNPWYDAAINIYKERIIENISVIKNTLQQESGDQYKEKKLAINGLNIVQVEGLGRFINASSPLQKIVYSFIPMKDYFLDIYAIDVSNDPDIMVGYNKIIDTFKFDK